MKWVAEIPGIDLWNHSIVTYKVAAAEGAAGKHYCRVHTNLATHEEAAAADFQRMRGVVAEDAVAKIFPKNNGA